MILGCFRGFCTEIIDGGSVKEGSSIFDNSIPVQMTSLTLIWAMRIDMLAQNKILSIAATNHTNSTIVDGSL